MQGSGLDSLRSQIPGPANSFVCLGFLGAHGGYYEATLPRTAYGSEDAAYRQQPAQQQNVVPQGPVPLPGRAPQLIRRPSAAHMEQHIGAQMPVPMHMPMPMQVPVRKQMQVQMQRQVQVQQLPAPIPQRMQQPPQFHAQPRHRVVSPTPPGIVPLQFGPPMNMAAPVGNRMVNQPAQPHFQEPARQHTSPPVPAQGFQQHARTGVVGHGAVVSTSAFEELGYELDVPRMGAVPPSAGVCV